MPTIRNTTSLGLTPDFREIAESNLDTHFAHDTNLTRAQLLAVCGITADVTPYTDVRGGYEYMSLNYHLRKHGRYIKASNYYSTFTVLSLPETEQQVGRYDRAAIRKTRRGDTLAAGVSAFRGREFTGSERAAMSERQRNSFRNN